jgi:hypothetical protein
MTEQHTFSWRPDLADESLSHLVIDGQTQRTSADYPGKRWVWAVCSKKANPDAPERTWPHVRRCPNCRHWLHTGEHPSTTKSPRPTGPESERPGA